jgi:hypothetical protein
MGRSTIPKLAKTDNVLDGSKINFVLGGIEKKSRETALGFPSDPAGFD